MQRNGCRIMFSLKKYEVESHVNQNSYQVFKLLVHARQISSLPLQQFGEDSCQYDCIFMDEKLRPSCLTNLYLCWQISPF